VDAVDSFTLHGLSELTDTLRPLRNPAMLPRAKLWIGMDAAGRRKSQQSFCL
jgi:hypothetical protein